MLYVGKHRVVNKNVVNDYKKIMLEIISKFFAYPYEKLTIDNLIPVDGGYVINVKVGKKIPIMVKKKNSESFEVLEERPNGNFDVSTFIITGKESNYPNLSFLGTVFDVPK